VRHHRYHRQGGSGPGLIEGLRRLEYRGYDSAGIATLVDGQIECRRMARSAHRRLGQGNYECYRQLAEAAEQRRKTATHPKRTGSRLDGMARREEQIELNRGGSFAEVCTPDVFRVAPRAGATTELILSGGPRVRILLPPVTSQYELSLPGGGQASNQRLLQTRFYSARTEAAMRL
jgi:hypothetical protein